MKHTGQPLSKTGQVLVTHTFPVEVSSPIVLVRGNEVQASSHDRWFRDTLRTDWEANRNRPVPSHSGRVAPLLGFGLWDRYESWVRRAWRGGQMAEPNQENGAGTVPER